MKSTFSRLLLISTLVVTSIAKPPKPPKPHGHTYRVSNYEQASTSSSKQINSYTVDSSSTYTSSRAHVYQVASTTSTQSRTSNNNIVRVYTVRSQSYGNRYNVNVDDALDSSNNGDYFNSAPASAPNSFSDVIEERIENGNNTSTNAHSVTTLSCAQSTASNDHRLTLTFIYQVLSKKTLSSEDLTALEVAIVKALEPILLDCPNTTRERRSLLERTTNQYLDEDLLAINTNPPDTISNLRCKARGYKCATVSGHLTLFLNPDSAETVDKYGTIKNAKSSVQYVLDQGTLDNYQINSNIAKVVFGTPKPNKRSINYWLALGLVLGTVALIALVCYCRKTQKPSINQDQTRLERVRSFHKIRSSSKGEKK